MINRLEAIALDDMRAIQIVSDTPFSYHCRAARFKLTPKGVEITPEKNK